MTSRERRVRQTEPSPVFRSYDRSDGPSGNERTAERRVASYRPLLNALAKEHAICGSDPCEFASLLAALRRPKVTEEELAEAIEDAWESEFHGTMDFPYAATVASRVALEKLK